MDKKQSGKQTHSGKGFKLFRQFSQKGFQQSEFASQLPEKLFHSLSETLDFIKNQMSGSSDLVIRRFELNPESREQTVLLYIDGLADTAIIDGPIMDSLVNHSKVLNVSNATQINNFRDLLFQLVSGNTILLMESDEALALSTANIKGRAIEEPTTQTVIRGPRDGFTENLRTNTALIRKRIRDPRLCCEQRQIGQVTQTEVAVMYIKGIVNTSVLDEVNQRLKEIHMDGVLESGNIEEWIQDKQFTPFPTLFNSERPDVASAALLEGRVVIVVDGTPFTLIAPVVFSQFFQAAEDYYQRADIAFFLRVLRSVCFLIALLFPAMYIAITTFHQEMLPTQLLASLAAQREGVPFPALVEAIIMEVTFEILREAGVRLPRPVGQAVSIVGALVIGQSAVEAGIVSAAMVIVVAITAIASFANPSFNMAISIRILRFIFMLVAATFGLYGITLGLITLVLHLCSISSFGIPYMTPFAPMNISDQRDTIFRLPPWFRRGKPNYITQFPEAEKGK